MNAIEDFDPNFPVNPFRWIPNGVYYDMFDARNEVNPIVDGVNGYTNLQFFNALDIDVRSMPQFRQRLFLETGFNAAVINLFFEYNY